MNDQLAVALAAEHAAIYAYGPIGVHLTAAAERAEARAAEAAHRTRRDIVIIRLAQLSAEPAAAPGGYALPFPVTTRAAALKLAGAVEDRVAAAWRATLPATTGADRSTALAALTDAAVRATRWRRLAGITPLTVPFPGRLP